ncbi:seminal metalloprotease 1 [Drosophila grimshawi]|uniref:Metalloendopeptidase n=1 Tax=Drosophila grimshawi TaxID=7222 RepID=B4JQV2_DROGR|nr:seminal metalloprotease 1 [Drosophila grimshawi]EDV99282.1 GH13112 [Drosophila grimshawi]
MQYYKTVLGLVLSTLLLQGEAAPLPAGIEDPEEAAGFVEGDMLLTVGQQLVLEQGPMGRNGLIDTTKRWPQNTVVYKISADFDDTHRQAILDGIQTLEEKTCVRFREANDEDDGYLSITAQPGGCYTAVGYLGTPQVMNLEIYPIGEGCFRPGTVLHEFMHALGFYHQQSSAIRDDFIEVIQENIVPGKEFNFKKYAESVVTDFDLGYDYNSCLHYRPGAFSINGEDTIVPLDKTAQIGQRIGLSAKDIDKINIMYKCPLLI